MTDLATAITAGRGGNASMRVGTVTAYEPSDGTVTVDVGGGSLLSCPYASRYIPIVGDTVIMLSAGAAWVVVDAVGVQTPPLTPQTAEVDPGGVQSTSSTTFTDLATVGPTITATVSARGVALVQMSARIGWSDGTADAADGGAMSCAVSGASSEPAGFNGAAYSWMQILGTTGTTVTQQLTGLQFMTGLNPGVNVFTAKYCSLQSGKSVDFSRRILSVICF